VISERGAESDGRVELALNRFLCHRSSSAVNLPNQLNNLRGEPDQQLGDGESLTVNTRKERRQIDVQYPYRLM
jgi:hypothetical protein